MATMESAKKICVVCGKDVAGQPRVKDAAGQYLCAGECEKRAAEAVKAKANAAPPPPPRSAPPAAVKPGAPPAPGGSFLSNLIEDSPMMKAAKCESCGNPMPGGAVLCTRCGFNTQTGKALKTAVIVVKEEKAPKVKVGAGRYDSRPSGGDWGPSFGVLFLMTFGVCGGVSALGFLHPLGAALGILLSGVVFLVAYVWAIIGAFRQGEVIAGVFGILGVFLPIIPLGFLIWAMISSEDKWSKALLLGSFLGGIVAVGVIFGVIGFAEFQHAANTP